MEENRKKCCRGEITASLCLIFVLLVSFILAMVESAQIQTLKNQRRLETDLAVYSTFGEYEKELLEEYEVFALDGGYGSETWDEQRILDRMAYYGSMGISQEITEIQFMTDNGGQAFREQVLEYMDAKIGLGALQDLTGLSAAWEEQKIKGEMVSDELDHALEQGTELLPEGSEELLQVNKTGILSLVMPRDVNVSAKHIEEAKQLSNRRKQTGRGTFPARTGLSGVKGKLLFHKYLLSKLQSCTEHKSEKRNLEYEIEYILGGKASDEENLKKIVSELLLVRMGMNYTYLMSDMGKQGEAETLAATIATVILNPEATEAIKQLLLLLWTFGESVVDLRMLLSGHKIAFMKNDTNWQLPLTSVLTFWNSEIGFQGEHVEGGWDYGQYLELLLSMKNVETVTMRTLDRVEQNLRFEKNMEHFSADHCVSKIKLKNKAEIWNGLTYEFPAYFGYL